MRPALLLLAAVLVAGCDGVPPELEPEGWMEGTVTLPDGAEVAFREEAGSATFVYSGLGTRDLVAMATASSGRRSADGSPRVSVYLSQEGDRFVAGTFSSRFDGTAPSMGATFTVTDVPGFVRHAPGPWPADVSAEYPEGTVVLRIEGDRLRGTFDLRGWPIGGGTLDGVDVRDLPEERAPRVRGRFDVVVPAPPASR